MNTPGGSCWGVIVLLIGLTPGELCLPPPSFAVPVCDRRCRENAHRDFIPIGELRDRKTEVRESQPAVCITTMAAGISADSKLVFSILMSVTSIPICAIAISKSLSAVPG